MFTLIAQLLPRSSEMLCLFCERQHRGWPDNDFGRIELCRREDDGFENIGGWHDKQMHRLACLFRKRDHVSEQQLLEAREKMMFMNALVPGVGSFGDLYGHHDQVFFARVRQLQSSADVIECVVVANETERVSGPNAEALV